MGWLLLAPDGTTVRCWNRNAQDDHPQPGETWQAWDGECPADLRSVAWVGGALVPVTPPPVLAPDATTRWLLDQVNELRRVAKLPPLTLTDAQVGIAAKGQP